MGPMAMSRARRETHHSGAGLHPQGRGSCHALAPAREIARSEPPASQARWRRLRAERGSAHTVGASAPDRGPRADASTVRAGRRWRGLPGVAR